MKNLTNNCKDTGLDMGGMKYKDLPKIFKEELDKVAQSCPDSKITGRIEFSEWGNRETYKAWLKVEDLAYGFVIIKYVSRNRGIIGMRTEHIEVHDIDIFDLDELNKL
jgi:hypothetical protein